MNDDNIEVNSELYFNEKLNFWLNTLHPADVQTILSGCLDISSGPVKSIPRICPWDSFDPANPQFGRFDQKIDVGKSLCVILELKVGTQAPVGQLDKYLSYIKSAGYESGYVVLLSRDQLASNKVGYGELVKKHPNLLFITWKSFEQKLKRLHESGALTTPKAPTETFLYLLSFLTDLQKRSERLILQPAPPGLDVQAFLAALEPAPAPKKKDTLFGWNRREQFWDELLEQITSQAKVKSFSAFRFDLYEYIMRWAFHKKKIYLDIYEDKNYEYFYNYFITHIYPHRGGLPSTQYSDLYYRFLLLRKTEYLKTQEHKIFFKKIGTIWYFYAISTSFTGSDVPYLKCSDLTFL